MCLKTEALKQHLWSAVEICQRHEAGLATLRETSVAEGQRVMIPGLESVFLEFGIVRAAPENNGLCLLVPLDCIASHLVGYSDVVKEDAEYQAPIAARCSFSFWYPADRLAKKCICGEMGKEFLREIKLKLHLLAAGKLPMPNLEIEEIEDDPEYEAVCVEAASAVRRLTEDL